jgi:tryptophan synthase alpha subunit
LKTPLDRYRGMAEGVIVGSSLLESILAGSDARAREVNARAFARAMKVRLPALAPL